MNKTILATAAFFGFLAVVLGALGAHYLKIVLSDASLESFRTGVAYQMYHALFLMFLGNTSYLQAREKRPVYLLILAGVLCFSFSIYGLTTGPLAGLDFSSIAWITPLGGILLMGGWLLMLYRVFKPVS